MTSHRDAITGQYVTAEHAEANPDTTVSEQRTPRPASDYAELRRLAEACPMPDNDPDTLSEWYELKDLTGRNYPLPPIDAAFIAAASPDVVLGLLGELDLLREVRAAVHPDTDPDWVYCGRGPCVLRDGHEGGCEL